MTPCREGSGGGRVTPKAKGTGGDLGNRKSTPGLQVSKARDKERHQLLQEEVRAGVEEERVSRARTRWESTLQRKVT